MAQPDTEKIIEKYREYNRGDVALGRHPNQQPTAKQQPAMRGNIEPGYLFNKGNPDKNYQFAWCPFGDDDFYYDLRDDGYKPVIESEWILARKSWDWRGTPESDRWRFGASSVLMHRNQFLMYRDEEAWLRECDRRLALSEESIKGRSEAAMDSADRIAHEAGVEVELEANGKPNKAGVRRTIVS